MEKHQRFAIDSPIRAKTIIQYSKYCIKVSKHAKISTIFFIRAKTGGGGGVKGGNQAINSFYTWESNSRCEKVSPGRTYAVNTPHNTKCQTRGSKQQSSSFISRFHRQGMIHAVRLPDCHLSFGDALSQRIYQASQNAVYLDKATKWVVMHRRAAETLF